MAILTDDDDALFTRSVPHFLDSGRNFLPSARLIGRLGFERQRPLRQGCKAAALAHATSRREDHYGIKLVMILLEESETLAQFEVHVFCQNVLPEVSVASSGTLANWMVLGHGLGRHQGHRPCML